MKKNILFVIVLILITVGCSSNYLKNTNLKSLNKMLDKKETFVLYLNDNDEGKILSKTLKKVCNSHKINCYSLNTIKLNDDDLKSLKKKFMFDETNIILFVKKGTEETVLSRIDDLYISEKKLEQELKNQNYIK